MNEVEARIEVLLAHRARFLSFVHSRVPDRAAAEDLLQSMFARIIEAGAVVPADHPIPWFYRVLRNAIIDRHRRLAVERRNREAWERDPAAEPAEEPPRRLCRCTLKALASLKPEYVRMIEAVDLNGLPVVEAARAFGLSQANGHVRLHRARRLLAERLRATCRHCAERSCGDCDCKGSTDPA